MHVVMADMADQVAAHLQAIQIACIGECSGSFWAASSSASAEGGHQAFYLGGLPIGSGGLRGPVGGACNPMLEQPVP